MTVNKGCRWLAMVILSLLPAAGALADASMQEIQFSSLPGDKIEIRMVFDDEPPIPTGYTIEQPARIALDLLGVSSALQDKYHSLGSGNAQSITVVEAGDRTRVIVSLTELVAYTTTVQGNTLYVLVGDGLEAGAVVDTDNDYGIEEDAGTRMLDQDLPYIEDIDFRRGERGEGQVVVTLSDPGIGVDVSSRGGDIKVLFPQTIVPERLQRRLDVRDFATPVLIVDALPEANDTVLTIEPNNDVEHEYLAYQTDNVFTLEVKPVGGLNQDSSTANKFLFTGEKLSLNFQDIEVRSVLQLIADFTDLNLVASDTVAGRITLRLKNVPWDQALEIIMKAKGLDKRLVGNVLMVAPAAELAARESLELENRQKISELAPLRTEFIEVKYAKANEIFELFAGGEGNEGILSERGRVIVDERTNSIILTETVDKINEFRSILDKLDIPVRQVRIEARIVTADTSFTRNVGVRWGTNGGNISGSGSNQFGGNLGSVNSIRDNLAQGLPATNALNGADNLMVDLGVTSNTTFAFGYVSPDIMLDAEISLLETEGDGEVVARPSLITSDKTQAKISSGTKIPFQEAASSGATATSFIDATLSLEVTPQITPDDRLILDIVVTNDEVAGNPQLGPPPIETVSLTTQVLVDDGTTIVLGGVFTENTSFDQDKVPFLGDLPFVGSLFRNTRERDDKDELLIFITPHLMDESGR